MGASTEPPVWSQWRRAPTDALGSAGLSAHTWAVLEETAAFDPADGLIDRNRAWNFWPRARLLVGYRSTA